MKNPRLTPKDRALIKGALRRAFSRSELRLQALASTRIDHTDDSRPRVKKWSICAQCNNKVPTYTIDIDHKEPVIPLNSNFEDMSLDIVVDRMWCAINNLQGLCQSCHDIKSNEERAKRKVLNPKPPRSRKKK